MLHAIVDFGLAANARGINKRVAAALVFHHGVDRVARSAGNIRNNQAVLPQHFVDDGGFARVRLADYGNANAIRLLFLFLPIAQSVQRGVQNVSRTAPVQAGKRNGFLIEAKLVKLVKLHGRAAHRIALIDAGNDRFAAFFEHHGNVVVVGGNAGANVAHEQDHVGGVNGDLRLQFHLRKDHIVAFRLNAAGVDDHQLAAAPLGFAVNAVARDAGNILHNGAALADKFIEQGAFSNVRSAHNGKDRF